MRELMDKRVETELLVCRAQGGDRQAFDSLVERYRERLGAMIRSQLAPHLRQTVEVEELVQETLVRAFRSLERFRWRGKDSFYAWLCAIARHVVLKALERGRRYQALEIQTLTAEQASPSRTMRRGERLDRLEAAIRDLSPDYREVIKLARIDGLRIKDIAAHMHRSPGAVKVLLLRALRELKRTFGDTESLHLPNRSLEVEGGRDGD
jgi:RNA polymerase sigma-70 factor (ECF subfamily)